MSDPIFERYKEALKAGHVAVLRNRLDDALAHYREASEIAPERSLPHSSMGGVLQRLGRVDDALAAYARALGRTPRDEGALNGRAEVLIAAGRPVEAAEALERLAAVQEATDRRPEARETLQRALSLASTKRRLKRLAALEIALGGPETPPAESPAPVLRRVAPTPMRPRRRRIAPHAQARAVAAAPPAPAPRADPDALLLAAADAALEGRLDDALAGYVAAAAAHREAGHAAAGFDSCQRGLALAPGSPALHVELASLYLASGWRERAVEKLALLDRLLEIDGDEAGRAAAAAFVRRRLPDEPQLTALAAIGAD